MASTHAAYGGPHVSRIRGTEYRSVARSIIKKMPSATHRERGLAFMRLVEDKYPDLRIDVYTYVITNEKNNDDYHVRNGHDGAPPPSPKERAKTRAKVERAAKEIVQRIARVVVLDLMCPNGKTVRQNTGTYVEKLGGHLAIIGRAAGKKIVGKALTDAEATKLIAKS